MKTKIIQRTVKNNYKGFYNECTHKINMRDVCGDVILEEILFDEDIEEPLFENGQEIYIEKLKSTHKIIKVARSSDNGIVYYIEDKLLDIEEGIMKVVEDAEKQARELIEDKNKEIRLLNNEKWELKKNVVWSYRVCIFGVITMAVFLLYIVFSIYKII